MQKQQHNNNLNGLDLHKTEKVDYNEYVNTRN